MLLPSFGVTGSAAFLSSANLALAVALLVMSRREPTEGPLPSPEVTASVEPGGEPYTTLIAAATGFVTFGLEVVWFRSLKAAFGATTETFAIVLAAVLILLAVAAATARRFKRPSVGALAVASGVVVLLSTPVLERVDLWLPLAGSFWSLLGQRLLMTTLVLSLPVGLLGILLPMILDQHVGSHKLGWLYGFNALGAVLGSLVTAWILLPTLGVTHSAWALGLLMILLGLKFMPRSRAPMIGVSLAALLLAALTESGVGSSRIVGQVQEAGYRVLAFREGPDATVSVVSVDEGAENARLLFVDGFEASGERASSHYMGWMGRIPMLLHPAPSSALVICFGTGQTVNGVRREGAESIDVVDLNRAVFDLAPYFPTNDDVLRDPRVRVIVMDGRAWLRRTDRRYDVVTLEPMPPNHAGVNSLYSEEFYRDAYERLNSGGIIAQWLPFHLVEAVDSASLVATMEAVFEETVLWIDPRSRTGVIVARKGPGKSELGMEWPGLARAAEGRSLSPSEIQRGLALPPDAAARYAKLHDSD